MANYFTMYKPFSKEKQVGKREKKAMEKAISEMEQAISKKVDRDILEALKSKPIKKVGRLKRVSDKQAKELVKRVKLKKELIEESGGLCMICGKPPDFRGLNLIHKKALSAGGKTNRKNCLVGCQKCHGKEYHHIIEP